MMILIDIDCVSDGDGVPLTQPQPSHGTLGGGSCPGTPEMRRRQEEAMRRLASQVHLFKLLSKHMTIK